jgi:NADH:ubiquinone oxidoreductase subunit 5 (subunit L)/multisubunit Na+/H+ antiporter MnhA subunit
MLVMITFVSLWIFVFSLGYMAADQGFSLLRVSLVFLGGDAPGL